MTSKRTCIIMFALASIVATGRVLSNMHSIVDVIGGVVFAFIFTGIYSQCLKKSKSKSKNEATDEQNLLEDN